MQTRSIGMTRRDQATQSSSPLKKTSSEKSEIRQAIARQNFTFQGLTSRYTNNFCTTNVNSPDNSEVVKVLSYGLSY